jgi:hypothetical protein
MMTPAELAHLGRETWGRDWLEPLAAAIRKSRPRTVRRWRDGDVRIEQAESDHVRRVCAEVRYRARCPVDPRG